MFFSADADTPFDTVGDDRFIVLGDLVRPKKRSVIIATLTNITASGMTRESTWNQLRNRLVCWGLGDRTDWSKLSAGSSSSMKVVEQLSMKTPCSLSSFSILKGHHEEKSQHPISSLYILLSSFTYLFYAQLI
jgi:hypothetical protein